MHDSHELRQGLGRRVQVALLSVCFFLTISPFVCLSLCRSRSVSLSSPLLSCLFFLSRTHSCACSTLALSSLSLCRCFSLSLGCRVHIALSLSRSLPLSLSLSVCLSLFCVSVSLVLFLLLPLSLSVPLYLSLCLLLWQFGQKMIQFLHKTWRFDKMFARAFGNIKRNVIS